MLRGKICDMECGNGKHSFVVNNVLFLWLLNYYIPSRKLRVGIPFGDMV